MPTGVQPSQAIDRVEGALTLGSQAFPFYLRRRPVTLGPAGEVDFYYMPPDALRGGDPEREVSNFRSCVAYWYTGMQESGAAGEWDQLRHLVTATSYALVNRDKGPQSIYRDAFLRSGAFNVANVSLPDDVRERIRKVVRDRDRDGVKRELDSALGSAKFECGDLLGYQSAFGFWADKGVNAFRERGLDGLEAWLAELDYWLRKYRKRCPPRVRGFINFFSYQAKVSFYLCYATFWSRLIPWLGEHHGLNEPSRRFLSFWHNQNQPIEIPHGQTRSGIHYATRGGTALLVPDGRGGFVPQAVQWRTERIGPAHVPDVFGGQVLAMHPLSWLLLSDPALRTAVGRCIAAPQFNSLLQEGSVELFGEYWGMVDAIVTAAYLYRRCRDEYERQRGACVTGGDASEAVERDDTSPCPEAFLAGYIRARNLQCDCGGRFEFDGVPVNNGDGDQDGHELHLRCGSCQTRHDLTVTRQQIEAYLLGE